MAKAIHTHNFGPIVAMALLAALFVLVGLAFAVRQATTTSHYTGTPAIGADRAGGSGFDRDPYIARHAAVVARYHQ